MRNRETDERAEKAAKDLHGKFMIWVEGKSAPTLFQDSATAQEEMKRLATKEMGKQVVLLRCEAVCIAYPAFSWGFVPEEFDAPKTEPGEVKRPRLECPVCD